MSEDKKELEFNKQGGEEIEEEGNNVDFSIDFRPSYNLFDEVWFYLSDSLDLKRGMIVGFFLWMDDPEDDSQKTYYYQVQYYKKMKDESMKMFLGTVTEDVMAPNREDIEEEFEKVKQERIKIAIEQGEQERKGAQASKETHEEKLETIDEELKRLRSLQKEEYMPKEEEEEEQKPEEENS